MVNINGINDDFQERLRQAESAEIEMQRLQPLAAEAPQLRVQKAKAQKEDERRRAKEESLIQAKRATQSAADKQIRVPEMLDRAANAVMELYILLKDVDSSRQQALESLAVADRVDYDIELEESEEHERSLDRDTRGLAYALAARHGDTKVQQMLQDLDPEFSMLQGCNLDEPLYRDVANFVLRHAAPKEAVAQSAINPPEEELSSGPDHTSTPVEPFPPQPTPEQYASGTNIVTRTDN